MIEIIKRPAFVIARSSGGNPVLAMLVVFGFWVALNLVAGQVETLIWGSPFPHWMDVVVLVTAIIYAAACVWYCAVINVVRDKQQEEAER